jgi:hypothetical protein
MGRVQVLVSCLCCVGCCVTFLNADSMPVQSTRPDSRATTAKQARTAAKETTFESVMMGEMRDENGVHLGFTNFKASDGIVLTVLYTSLGSPENALSYFEKKVAKAEKVIERKNKLSQKEM